MKARVAPIVACTARIARTRKLRRPKEPSGLWVSVMRNSAERGAASLAQGGENARKLHDYTDRAREFRHWMSPGFAQVPRVPQMLGLGCLGWAKCGTLRELPATIVVVVGDGSLSASAAIARGWLDARPGATVIRCPAAATLPFTTGIAVPSAPAIVWIPELHEAFVNRQGSGTRLVTTQAGYQLLAWLERTKDEPLLLLATANRDSLQQHAPELLSRRGGLGRVELQEAARPTAGDAPIDLPGPADAPDPAAASILA